MKFLPKSLPLLALVLFDASCIVRAEELFNITKTSVVDPKLGTELSALYDGGADDPSAPVGEEEYISLDIAFTSPLDKESAKAVLRPAVPVETIECVSYLCSVRVPVSALKDIASIEAVHFLRAAKAMTNVGLVTSEGDVALYADIARKKYSVNGSGLLIGVMSDSYNCLGEAAIDIRFNDLPDQSGDIPLIADLDVVECQEGSDEGRAMMQVIHDVAPGARLAFRTAARGQADFATGVAQLAAIGCDIIVDDITNPLEPMFQDGVIAQAVDSVVSKGVAYFSSAGNFGTNSWVASSGFTPVTVGGVKYHQFGTDFSTLSPVYSMGIKMNGDEVLRRFIFQWDEAFFSASGAPGSRSDLDVYFYIGSEIVARGEDYNVGRDAVELFWYTPPLLPSGSTVVVDFRIVHKAGPLPKYMKLLAVDEAYFEFPTFSPTSFGHANSARGAGVGAANYKNTPAFSGLDQAIINPYSSGGGTPIFFYPNGQRRSHPEIRKQPHFTGPDGIATTFFDEKTPDGKIRFSGTSASAPHVAAVAALMLHFQGGKRSLKPAKIYSILRQTAVDMDDPATAEFDVGWDSATGAGFVQALAALDALAQTNPAPNPAPKANMMNMMTKKK